MTLRTVKKFRREEKGLALVLVAASLTAILGFTALVVDVSSLYLTKSRLVNASDAAALAGAREMPDGDPETVANNYLQKNGVDPTTEGTVSVDTDTDRVTVETTRTVTFSFAPVLGFSSLDVTARATAEYGPVSAVDGIAPFGVPDQDLDFGKQYVLKEGSGPSEDDGFRIHGNFGALALGGTGANNYLENLKYGYHGGLSVGEMVAIDDTVSTEPGNMSGPTYEGVTYRINQCDNGCTADDYQPDCSRVILVPVYDPSTLGHGRDDVRIVGFASFFLEGVDGSGNESEVTGTFLEMTPPPETAYDIDPDAPDYGLSAARLVE